ncbi:MAG: hypothetical protein HW390_645 [Candidatus Brocadiaceae bacterium]|nr:hypothetical protein [Candidatus Brocadiaceae bacterium]
MVCEVQLVNYLVATGMPVGLILDFGESRVEFKRKNKKCPVNPVILSKIALVLIEIDLFATRLLRNLPYFQSSLRDFMVQLFGNRQ